MGITLTNARYEEIKQIVVDLFVKYDVRCTPVSGFELASKMGVMVIPYSAYNEADRALMLKQSDDGFCALFDDGSWRIFYNEDHCYGRINHTIFHEIGHIVLDHTEDSELAEKEVQFFAKYALVPPVLVHRLKLDTAEQIVDHFDVSYQAAIYALDYYHKWLRYGSPDLTDYEITLLKLFDNAA